MALLTMALCLKFAYYAPLFLVCSNNYFTVYRKSKLKQDGSSLIIELQHLGKFNVVQTPAAIAPNHRV